MADIRPSTEIELELQDYIGSAYSPKVEVTETEDGHTVSITSRKASGIVTDEFDVKDGFDPVATVARGDHKAVLTVTDKFGTTTADIPDGVSPRVEITEDEDGHTVSITDAYGTHSYDVPDWSGDEQERVEAEERRVAAESARSTAESQRVAAETQRASAETARKSAENARSAAEGTRVQSESQRAANEAQRAAGEAQRGLNEQARVASETARETAWETMSADVLSATDDANEAAATAMGVSVSMLGNTAHTTITGTSVHASDAISFPPVGLSVHGASVQSGTPSTASPKPISHVTSATVRVTDGWSVPIDLDGNVLRSAGGAVDDIVELSYAGVGATEGTAVYDVTLHANVGTVTLNGTEEWSLSSLGLLRTTAISDLVRLPKSTTELVPLTCTQAVATSYADLRSTTGSIAIAESGNVFVNLPNITTVGAIRTWLSNHPMTVVYPLATPSDTSLGRVTLQSLPAPEFAMAVDGGAVQAPFDLSYVYDVSIAEQERAEEWLSLKSDAVQATSDAVSAATSANAAATSASAAATNANATASSISAAAARGDYDGYSPTVAIADTELGHTVTITDRQGPHAYTVPTYADEEQARQDAWDQLSQDAQEAIDAATEAAESVSDDVDALYSSLNTLYDAAILPNVIIPKLEVGGFNSTTGEKTSVTNRARTVDYIADTVTMLVKLEVGLLLYAWDATTDEFIGFWGGSSFVKSRSQYLHQIDMDLFRAEYPYYKFKVVAQVDSTSTTEDIKFYSDVSVAQKALQVPAAPAYWTQGYYDFTKTGLITPWVVVSNTRRSCLSFIDSRVKAIKAKQGYLFRIAAFSDSKTPVGVYRTSGAFEMTGTSANLTEFDLSPYSYYGYKLTILKDDDGVINMEEARDALVYLYYSLKNGSNAPDMFDDQDRNLCLAGIKTDILDSKIPYHRGFLFHKLQDNDNSLWYGTNFDNIAKIGNVGFDTTLMRFAISPTDGRIIATQRDSRSGIWIWDGTTTTRLNSFAANPCGWLYNSGVDFIKDENGDEYCVFAEYWGTNFTNPLYVWRGKYPYTSGSDWEIVLTQTSARPGQTGDITHFHMVRRDPWTDILYLTSGDDSDKCKWWYSNDCGATWTLLTDGDSSGFENSVCRTINFVFTEDYVYWATDYGTNHCLNQIERGGDGILDMSTRVKLCDLPAGHATNSLCYVESPNGLFMYERVDTGFTSHYGEPAQMLFWNLETEQLETVVTLPLVDGSTWGGSRGKCYVNYTNSKQPLPAMGFSIDTPCIFDLVCDDVTKLGTIAYNVGSRQVTTIEY